MLRRVFASASAVGLIAISLTSTHVMAQAAAPTVQNGGSVTIGVVGTSWYPFDPPEFSNGTTHANYFDAIFGQLFDQEPNGAMKPDMAQSAKYSADDKHVTITLRKGIKFSNGMPVDAKEMQWNFTRDMISDKTCTCHPCFTDVMSVSTTGPLAVTINLKSPNATIVQCFEGHAPNFLIPESVWKAEGSSKFGLHPIGAGPYEVVTNDLSSKLVLKRNPNYFKKGSPHLSTLTFQALNADQAALEALQAGQIQVAVGVTTPNIITQATKDGIDVQTVRATSMGMLQFNTTKPPFNEALARDAVAAAIDPGPILKASASGQGFVAESMQGPGGLFFSKTVRGFHGFDLSQAKADVQKLGGLAFQIQGGNTPAQNVEEEAIQSELAAAGMKVTLVPEELTVEVENFERSRWQVIVGCAGGVDPDVGGCAYPERFATHAEYSGAVDPHLTQLIAEEQNTVNSTKRGGIQRRIDETIAKNVYAVPLYAANTYVLSSSKVNPSKPGPGGGGGLGITLDYDDLGLLAN